MNGRAVLDPVIFRLTSSMEPEYTASHFVLDPRPTQTTCSKNAKGTDYSIPFTF